VIEGGVENMISLEIARKLKEAGLVWEPQKGDLVYHDEAEESFNITAGDMEDFVRATRIDKEYAYSIAIFLPRLDQLLAEIRELGYKWFMETDTERYLVRVVEIKKPNNFHVVFSDSPANAAAEALLWIYERRAATGCGLSDG